MIRVKDNYLDTIQMVIPLVGKRLLEIGCGDGTKTVQIAEYCTEVVGIDPNPEKIVLAREQKARQNVTYQEGSAAKLTFDDSSFDIVFFTLSFHHVSINLMAKAIDESVRVVKRDGLVIFLEPAFSGTYFDAQIRFDACSGDERKEKTAAYAAMRSHPQLQEIHELGDETIFQFDSLEDFCVITEPTYKNTDEIKAFLEKNDFKLNAGYRVNIFRPKK